MTADRAAHQEQAAQQQATQQSTISTQSQQSDHRTDNAQTAFAPEKSDAAAKTAPFAAKSAASIGRSISMATPGPSFTAPPASTTASASTTATPAPTQTPLGQRRGFVGAPLLHSPTTFRPDLAPALMSAPPQSTANPFGGVTGDHVGGSTSRPVTPAATSVMRSRAPSAGSTYGSVAAQFGVRGRLHCVFA